MPHPNTTFDVGARVLKLTLTRFSAQIGCTVLFNSS